MKALIDGDILVYRMAFATQKTIWTHNPTGEYFEGIKKAKEWFRQEYGFRPGDDKVADWMKENWRPDDWTDELQVEPFSHCSFLIDNCIEGIVNNTHSDKTQVFLSDSRVFRHDVATVREYKANRPTPPVHKQAAREYLTNWYGAEVGENLEADDMLGLNQTTETVICSIDKDLLQIPGKHYHIVDEVLSQVDMYEADCMFFQQLMAGDLATDNIPGLPGIGEAKAAKIVDEFAGDHKGLVEEIEAMYEDAYPGQGREIMEEMAQLVYILRPGDVLGENEQWRALLST